eukprot:scaffold109233_cov60-Phaeocystis_antarctica.AAC.4
MSAVTRWLTSCSSVLRSRFFCQFGSGADEEDAWVWGGAQIALSSAGFSGVCLAKAGSAGNLPLSDPSSPSLLMRRRCPLRAGVRVSLVASIPSMLVFREAAAVEMVASRVNVCTTGTIIPARRGVSLVAAARDMHAWRLQKRCHPCASAFTRRAALGCVAKTETTN